VNGSVTQRLVMQRNFIIVTLMQFILEQRTAANLITYVGPEGIRVGHQPIARSVILSAAELISDWSVSTIQALDLESLEPALALAPEILILGTGDQLRFPASALYVELAARGIGLEVMDTAAACRTYNVLVNDYRPVVAALILP
jgi:uncharacterized protein